MKIPHLKPGESIRLGNSNLEMIFPFAEKCRDILREQQKTFDVRLGQRTEGFLRSAIEQGEGWNVWRGGPYFEDGDPGFSARYDFKLIAPGSDEVLEQPGVLFVQPPLTEGERARLLDGRHDWKEDRWEDHCGVPGCGHSCCEDYRGSL